MTIHFDLSKIIDKTTSIKSRYSYKILIEFTTINYFASIFSLGIFHDHIIIKINFKNRLWFIASYKVYTNVITI